MAKPFAMQSELQAVLDLQPSWVARAPSDDMALRGLLIRNGIPDLIRERRAEVAGRLQCLADDIEIEGKDSTGYYSRVPWVRFANRRLSPNPREGWYAVYLFAEDGSEVALSLNQGTQVWDGMGMRSRPEASIRRRSEWARQLLGGTLADRPRLSLDIALGVGDKARAYESGNVIAYRYPSGMVPSADALGADLLEIADLLRLVYLAEAESPVPGDPAEVVEAERVTRMLAGRSVSSRTGFRANAKQRKAIELRAMDLATAHYVRQGATVEDVSTKRPFDLEVRLGEEVLSVEVKGTTSDGREVLLTRGEVEHHRRAHPANALVVVFGIRLQGSPDAPEAVGGDLFVVAPWTIDDTALTALAFRYVVSRS